MRFKMSNLISVHLNQKILVRCILLLNVDMCTWIVSRFTSVEIVDGWLAGWLLSCRRRSLYLLLIWSVEYGILERKNRDRFSFALLANCRFIHLWLFYIPHISKLVRWLNRCLFCNLTDLRYIHLTIYKFCMPFCNTLMLNGNVELCHNVWNSIDDFAATISVNFHFFFLSFFLGRSDGFLLKAFFTLQNEIKYISFEFFFNFSFHYVMMQQSNYFKLASKLRLYWWKKCIQI